MGLGVVTGSLSVVRTVLNGQNVAYDTSWDSLPNWYWRALEVFFGVVAACIPTLRPGYKWLRANSCKKATTLEGDTQRKAKKWIPPKPSAFIRSLRSQSKTMFSTRDTGTSTRYTGDDDVLVLQDLGPSNRNGTKAENFPTKNQEQKHYPREKLSNERQQPLHITGDISTRRPGHFKRLDSEAKVGGGFGAEEVEERI